MVVGDIRSGILIGGDDANADIRTGKSYDPTTSALPSALRFAELSLLQPTPSPSPSPMRAVSVRRLLRMWLNSVSKLIESTT